MQYEPCHCESCEIIRRRTTCRGQGFNYVDSMNPYKPGTWAEDCHGKRPCEGPHLLDSPSDSTLQPILNRSPWTGDELAKHDFILQGFMARTHTAELERLLTLKDLDNALISVAFLNDGGVELIKDKLAAVSKKVTVYAGIRNDITSRQGIEHLLDLGVTVYLVDTGSHRLIFHPKIYLSQSKAAAHLLLSSANFTVGGLHGNIEAGVSFDLDLANANDKALKDTIEKEITGLPAKYPKHIFQVTKASELVELEKEGRLLDESEVEPPRPYATKTGGTSGDKLERIKLLVKPLSRLFGKKPSRAPKPAATSTTTAGTTIYPSANISFELLWESTPLTERDLSIPKGATTHATGSINLDKGTLPAEIDHRDYFRNDVFPALTWTTSSTKTVDEAYGKFQLVIKGVNYGEFDLRIGHTTDKNSIAYKQRNAMTRLSWGPIKQYITDPQFIGRTMSLYRDTNDPTRFLIEID